MLGAAVCRRGRRRLACVEDHCRAATVDCLEVECGDNECELGEDRVSCPDDCITCGDTFCDAGETVVNCPADCSEAPDNDTCAGAAALAVGDTAEGTTWGAGVDFGEARGPDVFYRLRIPRRMTVEILLEAVGNPGWDTFVFLLGGNCANLEVLGSDDDFEEVFRSRVVSELAAGDYYVVVSSFSDEHSGSFTLAATEFDAAVPTLADAQAYASAGGETYAVQVSGTDADEDAQALLFALLDGDGEDMDINGDGQPDQYRQEFDDVDWTGANFDAQVWIPVGDAIPGVEALRVQVEDSEGLISESVVAQLLPPEEVGEGERCDTAATFSVCGGGASCVADDGGHFGECTLLGDACPAGWAVVALDGLLAGDSLRYEGDTSGSDLAQRASCGGGTATVVHHFTMPQAGSLLVSTGETPEGADTLLSVRSRCADVGSELACNDDEVGLLAEALVEDLVRGQEVFILVDGYTGAAEGWSGPYVLTLTVQ